MTSSIGPFATTSPSRSRRTCDVVDGSSSRLWLTCTVTGESGEPRECREGEHERLAPREVHPGARLVQEEQGVLDEQRSGQQHPLPLTLRARAEGAVRQLPTAEGGEYLQPAGPVGGPAVGPPRREDVAAPGQDDIDG